MSSSPSSHIKLSQFDRFVGHLSDLETIAKRMGKRLDVFLIPLTYNDKNPSIPRGESWLNREQFGITLEEARERLLNDRGNYGIVGTCNPDNDSTLGLFFLDVDLDDRGYPKLPEAKLTELINGMNTLTIKTRSGGRHLVFAADSSFAKEMLQTCGTVNPKPRFAGNEIGELRAFNQYVVGIGSYVPNTESDTRGCRPDATGYYEIYHDAAIRIMDRQTFPKWLAFQSGKSGNAANTQYESVAFDNAKIDEYIIKLQETHDPTTIVSGTGVSLANVMQNDPSLSHLLSGADSVAQRPDGTYQTRSDADFAVIRQLKKYGFSAEQAWAVLRIYRQYDKTLRPDYMERTISKIYGQVANDELTTTTATEQLIQILNENDDTEEIHLTEFPETLPANKVIHMQGMPRTGKSHNANRWLGQFESGTYVTPTHEILSQQHNKFMEMYPDKTSVRLIGKEGACNHINEEGRRFDCNHCPYKPHYNKDATNDDDDFVDAAAEVVILDESDDHHPTVVKSHVSHWQMESVARELVAEHNHITPEVIPDYYCKYYMLHYCQHEVDYVYTVPFYTTSTNESITRLEHRDVMIIDEDTAFKHYYPADLLLLEYGHFGHGTTIINDKIASAIPGLDYIEQTITTTPKKNDAGKVERVPKKRFQKWDKVILGIIDGIREIHNHIEIFRNNSNSEVYEQTIQKIVNTKIVSRNDPDNVPVWNLDESLKQRVLLEIAKFERDVHVSGENGLVAFFEPFLYPYKEKPFVEIGRNPKNLYLVGDKQAMIRRPDCADRYILIGFTEASLFAKQIAEDPKDRIRLRVTWFPYGKNFHVAIIRKIGDESKTKRQQVVQSIIRAFIDENVKDTWKMPFMILTSSQQDQENVWSTNLSSEIYMTRKDSIDKIRREWLNGRGLAFYQNSTISRGIDVPWNDVIIVKGCSYAQPYWIAVTEYHKDCIESLLEQIREIREDMKSAIDSGCREDEETCMLLINDLDMQIQQHNHELTHVEGIRFSIFMDETTNSCLRPTPVNNQREEQCKFIIMTEDDYGYLNPDAKSEMSKIDIVSKSSIREIVTHIRDCVSKVNPKLMTDREFYLAGAHTASIDEENVPLIKSGASAIQWGKSYTDAIDLFTSYAKGTSKITTPDKAFERDSVKEIARYMIQYQPAFTTYDTNSNNKSKAIKSITLMKWAKEHLKSKPFTKMDYYDAIRYLIVKRWVSVTKTESGRAKSLPNYDETATSIVPTDATSTVYSLATYDYNREQVYMDTEGEVTLTMRSLKIAQT